ncbi:MAG: DUF4870 domain-containing protein [Ktedonobacterales bacterium]
MYNQRSSYSTATVLGIDERFERPLCYLLGWITGVIFLIIERRNAAVRRHAYQSIVVFGTLTVLFVIISVLGGILGAIPILGLVLGIGFGVLGFIVGLVAVLAWLFLMFMAFISPETFIGSSRRDLM